MTHSVGEERAIYIMMGLLLAAGIVSILMMGYLVKQYKVIFGKSVFAK